MKLLLGSQSPRRKELLKSLGFNFEVVSISCEEIYPSNLAVEQIPEYLSELKANAYPSLKSDEVLLTSDTIVVLGGEVLGKPENEETAFAMLKKLSGKAHQVLTSVTVKSLEQTITKTDIAKVEFEELSDNEINYYIKTCKPLDKAGAYGIQDWLGMAKIKKIEGSFYTIMGLPTHLVYEMLNPIL